MNFDLAQSVVSALRGESRTQQGLTRLAGFSEADWKMSLFWLDASGLALPFYDTLRSAGTTDALPGPVRSRLESCCRDNQQRSAAMLQEFSRLNRALEEAGVEYAVLKGFSLTPEYCADPCLRLQVDFDYLVRPDQIPEVARSVSRLGYQPLDMRPTEAAFATRPDHAPAHEDLYRPPVNLKAEFHTALFESAEFGLHAPQDALDCRRRVEMCGQTFYALDECDQFLHRTLNVFQDVFLFSVRLSALLEIVHFVRRAVDNEELWSRIASRAGEWDSHTGAMVGMVLALANEVFPFDRPQALACWTIDNCPRSALSWVQRYGLRWALEPFPGSKRSLLMAPAFMTEAAWWGYARQSLLPLQLGMRWRRRGARQPVRTGGYYASRIWFHAREAARVALEIPRWSWARRTDQ